MLCLVGGADSGFRLRSDQLQPVDEGIVGFDGQRNRTHARSTGCEPEWRIRGGGRPGARRRSSQRVRDSEPARGARRRFKLISEFRGESQNYPASADTTLIVLFPLATPSEDAERPCLKFKD